MSQRNAGDSDAALVRRCLADDGDAWRELVENHRPGMIALARRVLPAGSAADVVDAVIADLWQRRKLGQYEGRSSLRTWLGAVVMNASLNARRAATARPESAAENDNPEPTVGASSGGEERQLSAVLRDAIASLAPRHKAMVLMHYEQGLTLDDMTAIFGASKSTLSRTLRQAREDILATAERLAHARGTTLRSLRRGIDLGQLDLDLRAACAADGHKRAGRVSNS